MTFGFSVVLETAPGSTAACPTGSCHTEMAVTKCAAGKVRPKVRRMDLEAQKGPKMRPKVQNVDLEAQERTGPSARTGGNRPERMRYIRIVHSAHFYYLCAMNEREIYFAGGCFWGVEHFFKGVDGVTEVTPGYANGHTDAPTYRQVYTDTTGFAETVRVRYRPEKVSLERLVRLFFAIIDPLSVNQQGHDVGTRYRTGVYYIDPAQVQVIAPVFAEVAAGLGAKSPGPGLATELEPLRNFYPAEEYHRDYLDKNPEGYCHLPLKAFRYLRLCQDLPLLLGDEPDPVARMAEAAALIHERMHFFWTGFYSVKDEQLVLGPFQGPAACFRIGYGKGVCGTAWARRETVVVPDVEAFPGHIACSSLSRSEIVVPVIRSGEVVAVLDIDSKELDTFDRIDAAFLELMVASL